MRRVAFLGLGAMGLPMAERILRAGFPLTVWNRSPERAARLTAEGARLAASPRQAAEGADAVCTMLKDPAAIDAVALGEEGLVAGLAPGAVWLDFSTVTPDDSRRFAAGAAGKGADFCDVPVAGSVIPARDGTLTLLAGGDPAVLARVDDVLAAVSTRVEHAGAVGMGSALKLANNLLVCGTLALLGEALGVAGRLGLSPEVASGWLGRSAGASPYAIKKLEFLSAGGEPAQFTLGLAAKDMRLVAESAGGDVVAAVRGAFQQAAEAGLSEKDFGHVVSFLRTRRAGPAA